METLWQITFFQLSHWLITVPFCTVFVPSLVGFARHAQFSMSRKWILRNFIYKIIL